MKTISDLLRYINFGDVVACRVFVCASQAIQSLHNVRRTYKHKTCYHITKFKVTKQITHRFNT